MNVLISNSVPLNGGDEALLQATVDSLKERWSNCTITVLCDKVSQVRQRIPNLVLEPDLEFVSSNAERNRVSSLYRSADIILSAPGGFLHDFYSITNRLDGFEVALSLGKPIILFAQSVGPFWKPESLRRIPHVLNRFSRICVRDSLSKQHLLSCGVDDQLIEVTADAAFLWRRLAPDLFRDKRGRAVNIALSFRVWPLGDHSALLQIIDKAERLCRYLLRDPDRRLVFLSTCQGIDHYVDDSQVASQIVDRLPITFRDRCQVDRERYRPRELIRRYSTFDAFIGMRLHGCILAMLGGTAALGLGYERKTAEIFGQLGLTEYQVDFDSEIETWLQCTDHFLKNVDEIRNGLLPALNRQSDRASVNLDIVQRVVESSPSGAPRMAPEFPQISLPQLEFIEQHLAPLVEAVNPSQILAIGSSATFLHCSFGIPVVGCDFERSDTRPYPMYQCDFNRESLPVDLQELDFIVCSGVFDRIANVPHFLEMLHDRLGPEKYLVAYLELNYCVNLDLPELFEDVGFSSTEFTEISPEAGSPAMIAVTAQTGSTAFIPAGRICKLVPHGESFILVDDLQWSAGQFPGRFVLPFLENKGEYWGPPANDAHAVAELERLRAQGASSIVFGQPSLWWLVQYPEFSHYLRANYPCAFESTRLVAFDLRQSLPSVAREK